MWERGSNNKLEQVQLKKSTPMAQKMSKNWMCLYYKQYKQHRRDSGDMDLQKVTLEDQCPEVSDILASPIDK